MAQKHSQESSQSVERSLVPALRIIKGTVSKGRRAGQDYTLLVVDKGSQFNSFTCLEAERQGVEVIDIRESSKQDE